MAVIEEAKIVLEDGTELKQWDSYTIDSDFMTPTDGWSFTVGDQALHVDANYKLLHPDRRVQIYVDGMLQLTGIIDSVEFSSSVDGGTTCTVQGRDILRTLCKANIWPGFSVKGLTVSQMIEKVLALYYPGDTPTLFTDSQSNRTVQGVKTSLNGKDRSAKQKKLIERSQAHPNEGAFEFLSRNIRRFGLWIWATADGNVVVSGPEYDQEPSYNVSRLRGDKGANWTQSSFRIDRTSVPTQLIVRGKSAQKEWEKSSIKGSVAHPDALPGIIEPAYLAHDEAKTVEQCEAFARQEMSRLTKNENVYTVTAVGHRDRFTGNMFEVDTLATVDDQFADLQGTMYVSGRTFRKDLGGGTTTELRMVPLGAIVFSDVDWAI